MTQHLWRLRATPTPHDSSQLVAALRAYLAHARLTTTIVQIGARARAYLALEGCAGCVSGRCLPGCRADLLRRALQAGTIGTMTLVRDGLARRAYTRAVLAFPTPRAQRLGPDLLEHWDEARLMLSWHGGKGDQLRAATLLLTGSGGAEPAAVLRARGRRPLVIPPHILLRRYHQPLPSVPPLAVVWSGDPYLLMTESDAPAPPQVPSAAVAVAPVGVDGMLAEWLHLACTDPERVLREAQAVRGASPEATVTAAPSDGRWPSGPTGMAPTLLGELVPQLLVEPSFQSTRKGQSGITKGRLVGLRHSTISDTTARALMVWFDRAGLLAPPENGQGPWRAPRQFALQDLDAIAARLRDTSLPTSEAVRAAYGGE